MLRLRNFIFMVVVAAFCLLPFNAKLTNNYVDQTVQPAYAVETSNTVVSPQNNVQHFEASQIEQPVFSVEKTVEFARADVFKIEQSYALEQPLFTLEVAFADQKAEASSSWRKWAKKEGKKIQKDTRNDLRRDIKKDLKDWRKEQRNIARADGDHRFADRYLSDSQVRALRTLKSLPVSVESPLYITNSEANAIKSMCKKLPEFSYVRVLRDQYNEKLGIVVYRHPLINY